MWVDLRTQTPLSDTKGAALVACEQGPSASLTLRTLLRDVNALGLQLMV